MEQEVKLKGEVRECAVPPTSCCLWRAVAPRSRRGIYKYTRFKLHVHQTCPMFAPHSYTRLDSWDQAQPLSMKMNSQTGTKGLLVSTSQLRQPLLAPQSSSLPQHSTYAPVEVRFCQRWGQRPAGHQHIGVDPRLLAPEGGSQTRPIPCFASLEPIALSVHPTTIVVQMIRSVVDHVTLCQHL